MPGDIPGPVADAAEKGWLVVIVAGVFATIRLLLAKLPDLIKVARESRSLDDDEGAKLRAELRSDLHEARRERDELRRELDYTLGEARRLDRAVGVLQAKHEPNAAPIEFRPYQQQPPASPPGPPQSPPGAPERPTGPHPTLPPAQQVLPPAPPSAAEPQGEPKP